MKRYIGLDVHAASTTFAVISESGKRLGTYVVETSPFKVLRSTWIIRNIRTYSSRALIKRQALFNPAPDQTMSFSQFGPSFNDR